MAVRSKTVMDLAERVVVLLRRDMVKDAGGKGDIVARRLQRRRSGVEMTKVRDGAVSLLGVPQAFLRDVHADQGAVGEIAAKERRAAADAAAEVQDPLNR